MSLVEENNSIYLNNNQTNNISQLDEYINKACVYL